MQEFDVFVEGRIKIRYRISAESGGPATVVASDKFLKHFGPGTHVDRVYFEEVKEAPVVQSSGEKSQE
jgi:hypothetical protein